MATDTAAGTPTLLAVAGWPVGHSRSPRMMAAALRELGLDWRYLKLPLAPERFVQTVAALPQSGYVGLNVTIPHKLAALELADAATDAAAAIGAANTLSFDDGRVEADNTDAGGLLDAVGEPVEGKRALVLGAGGAGRAAVWALREAGGEVAVWNRTDERAGELARELGVTHVERFERADVLVNATSVGLSPKLPEHEALEALDIGNEGEVPSLLVDLVYGDKATALGQWAERSGARVVDGLEVLVRQGARSLGRWTGQPAPLEAMRQAARSAHC
ncbi:MAG: shikimate dehydrogenase [Thermoleophilaceae bacterium]